MKTAAWHSYISWTVATTWAVAAAGALTITGARTASAVARTGTATSVSFAVVVTVTIAVAGTAAGTFAATTTFAAFGGDDQLQQALRVSEKFIGSLRIQAEGVRGQLLRDSGPRDSGISGNEADFVDVNVRIALQSCF